MIASIKYLLKNWRTNAPAAGRAEVSQSNIMMDAPPQDRVVFRHVHKWFGSLEILAGVDLEINEGEVVVIIGPSGSGKTTVLRCLAGLEEIQSGEIYVFGHRVTQVWKLGGEVGFVFQQFNLFPHMTALQNVMLALQKARGMDKAAARNLALEMLDKVGLADKADARPTRLSGGQQQRVAIARSLAVQPKLMLFDEVTSALDRELVAEVLRTMKQLAEQGMTMVVVTHELSFAEQVADRLVFMDKGQIVEQGPPAQLLRNPQQERTRQFLGKILVDL